MRKPSYLGMQSDGWICVHYGINYLQPAYRKKRDLVTGKLVRNKSAGHRQYYYVFEQCVLDDSALDKKYVRLTAYEILRVKKGLCTVEDIANRKCQKQSADYADMVCYTLS